MHMKKRKTSFLLLVVLPFLLLLSGHGTAAGMMEAEINGQDAVSGSTLKGILEQYSFDEITSLVITGGSVGTEEFNLLKNTTPEEPQPTFLLPNLKRFCIAKQVAVTAGVPDKFMFQHPAIEVIELNTSIGFTLGERAFAECRRLERIHAPFATALGNSSFRMCQSLKTAEIPHAFSLGTYTFNGCTALSSITFGEIVPQEFPMGCFPEQPLTLRIPKGQSSTYQARLSHYGNLAFEEYGEESGVPDSNGNVILEGVAKASYTVSVTPSVSFGDLVKNGQSIEKNLEITAEELFLEEGQQVKAIVKGKEDGFYMSTAGRAKVPVEVIGQNGNKIASGGVFGSLCAQGERQTGQIVLNQNNLPFAGEYTGTLTFEFSVEDKS